jgi:hypothetical protein
MSLIFVAIRIIRKNLYIGIFIVILSHFLPARFFVA